MASYDTGQVCLNGHPINGRAWTNPTHNTKFCENCGAETITKCPACNSTIRGKYNAQGVLDVTPYEAPSFCRNCGKPYPWTESRLQAAHDLANELDELTADEKQTLSKSLDDLVRETPQTPVAVTRFKKLMKKAGGAAAEGLKKILVEVATEAIKKQLLGP